MAIDAITDGGFRVVGKVGSVVKIPEVRTIAKVTEPKVSDRYLLDEEIIFFDNLEGLINSILAEVDSRGVVFELPEYRRQKCYPKVSLIPDLLEQGCNYGKNYGTWISGARVDTNGISLPSARNPNATIKVNPRKLEDIDSLLKYVQNEFGIKSQAVWDRAVQACIDQTEHIVQSLKK